MLFDYNYFKDRHDKSTVPLTRLDTPPSKEDTNLYARYTCIQEVFLKSSWIRKLNIMKMLFDHLKEFDFMAGLFQNIFEAHLDKLSSYIQLQTFTELPYDNVLLDDDRTFEKRELETVIRNFIHWYKTIEEDMQIDIFLTLMVMGGGCLIHNLINYMQQFYKQKIRTVEQSVSEIQIIETSYVEKLNTHDPVVMELIKKRKQWNETIFKYRKFVQTSSTSRHTLVQKGTKKGRQSIARQSVARQSLAGNDKAKMKKASSSTKMRESISRKSESRSAEKGSTLECEIDYIQLMPIWIVKKIFEFLDKKTRLNIRKVNPYWNYAVQSLEKDMKARMSLDETIKQLESETYLPVGQVPSVKTCPTKKRMRFESQRRQGICSKEIRKALSLKKQKACTYSATVEAFHDHPGSYDMVISSLRPFARKKPDNTHVYDVYKQPEYMRFAGARRSFAPIDTLETKGSIHYVEKMTIVQPQESVQTLFDLMENAGEEGHKKIPSEENLVFDTDNVSRGFIPTTSSVLK